MRQRMVGWVVTSCLVIGLFGLQFGWVMNVPAFRGMDETEHVLKSAAVAQGMLRPSGQTSESHRGELVAVPRSLHSAERRSCEKFRAAFAKSSPDNLGTCETPEGDGATVQRSSAAATYQPWFYLLTAPAMWVTSGTFVVVVMRLIAAVVSTVFIVQAFVLARGWSRGRWPLAALILAITPTFLQATATPSPNGLEMAAGLAFWSCIAGFVVRGGDRDAQRKFVLLALPATAVLGSIRTLGPVWLILGVIVSAIVLRAKFSSCRKYWGRPEVLLWFAVAISSSLVNVAWVLTSGTNSPESVDGADPLAYADLFRSLPVLALLWLLQQISNSPQPIAEGLGPIQPATVFVIGIASFVAFLAAGWRFALTPERRAAAFIVLSVVTIALCVTFATYQSSGLVWQGRYAVVPMTGVFVLAGIALDRVDATSRILPVLVGFSSAASNVLSLLIYSKAASTHGFANSWSLDLAAVGAIGGLSCLAWAVYVLHAGGLAGPGPQSSSVGTSRTPSLTHGMPGAADARSARTTTSGVQRK